jgi:TetR/AcrR family transcriptional regulator, regulator of autoinduction and epiphytic fitness
MEAIAADADISGMQASVAAAAGDPRRQLRERLAFTVRFYAAGADLIHIARTVSGVEPDLREMWNEGQGRRHKAATALVQEWETAGVLAPGLTAQDASDLLWALSGPDVFRLIITDRHWSKRRFMERVAGMLDGVLFEPPPPPPA